MVPYMINFSAASFPRCFLKQKDYGNCLKHALETAHQLLANGESYFVDTIVITHKI